MLHTWILVLMTLGVASGKLQTFPQATINVSDKILLISDIIQSNTFSNIILVCGDYRDEMTSHLIIPYWKTTANISATITMLDFDLKLKNEILVETFGWFGPTQSYEYTETQNGTELNQINLNDNKKSVFIIIPSKEEVDQAEGFMKDVGRYDKLTKIIFIAPDPHSRVLSNLPNVNALYEFSKTKQTRFISGKVYEMKKICKYCKPCSDVYCEKPPQGNKIINYCNIALLQNITIIFINRKLLYS